MKFAIGDYVRHVNGVNEFRVHNLCRKDRVYALKEDGSVWIHYYAATHVDRMYRHVGYEGGRPFREYPGGESMVSKCSAVLDAPKIRAIESAVAVTNSSSDVTVSLPGLPAGYYLKAFRKALPGDLVLNTSGAVTPAKITQNGMTLYRPIVGKVSDIRKRQFQLPGVPEGWEAVSYRSPVEGEHYLGTYTTEVLEASKGRPIPTGNWPIVKPVPSLTPCDGTLPGIPKGYKLVGFGAVKEDQFFIDTVGTLKRGPAKNRLVLEQIPSSKPEVVTEYEIDCYGGTAWAAMAFYHFPEEINTRYTGRTRKVVVQ